MKPLPNFFATLAILAGSAFSTAALAAPPGLVLSVDSRKEDIHVKGKSEEVRGMTLDIRVQSPSTNTVKCTVEWFFVSSPVGDFGYYVSDRGSQDLIIKPRNVATTAKTAPLFVMKSVTLKGKPAERKIAEVKGYIIRVLVGKTVVASTGEPSFIKRKLEDPAEFKALLSAEPPKF